MKLETCEYCGQVLCFRYDAVRMVNGKPIHVSCQREKEALESLERMRKEREADVGGMP